MGFERRPRLSDFLFRGGFNTLRGLRPPSSPPSPPVSWFPGAPATPRRAHGGVPPALFPPFFRSCARGGITKGGGALGGGDGRFGGGRN